MPKRIGHHRQFEIRIGLDPLAFEDKQAVVVGRPLPGQQDLFVQHPGLLFRLFEDHLLVEHRRAVEHEKVEGGDDGADEHNEFGAERKPGGERSGHDLSALGRNLACC